LSQAGISLWGFHFIIGCLAGNIYLVVTCEGGIYPFLLILFPSQNPRSPGMSPLSLTSINRKNHPIMVTLGGIGSCYASLTFEPQAFILATNFVIKGTMVDGIGKQKVWKDCLVYSKVKIMGFIWERDLRTFWRYMAMKYA